MFLEDSMRLKECNIMDGTILTMIIRLTSKTQIIIRSLVPKTTTLDVDLNNTVVAVKEKIQEREDIPPDQQCL